MHISWGVIAHVGNERNETVKRLIREAIKECRKQKKYSGICGDAPSTFPEFTRFLIDCGIESISVNPDVAVRTKLLVAEQERKIKKGVKICKPLKIFWWFWFIRDLPAEDTGEDRLAK